MQNTLNSNQIILIITRIAHDVEKNIEYLTTLDQAIGDGDHGINLSVGFRAVLEKIDELKGKDIGTILKTVGQILIAHTGGSAGPLYGTIFIRAGNVAAGRQEIDMPTLVKMFEAGEQGIIEIGEVRLGEKTMLDAFHPAVVALKKAVEEGKSMEESLAFSAKAAEEGAKSTIELVSKKGRASYLGNRSLGHQDVGATSTCLMLKSISESVATSR